MPETGAESRSFSWAQNFPFVRLFRTFGLATAFSRLALALLCVLAFYLGGRLLDAIWMTSTSGAVYVDPADRTKTEIAYYAVRGPEEYIAWRSKAVAERREMLEKAADDVVDGGIEEARKKLESTSARSLILEKKAEKINNAKRTIDARERAALEAIKNNNNEKDKAAKRREVMQSADYLRIILARLDGSNFATPEIRAGAAARIGEAGKPAITGTPSTQQAKDTENHDKATAELNEALTAAGNLRAIDESAPRGPFISLVDYEANCFAQAVRGVCALRFSYAGLAFSDEPSLLGSIASAGSGGMWLLFYRPWYTLIFGLIALLLLAFFGGAICRSAAVQSARDESISLGESLRFAREKLVGLVLAPVIPIAIFFVLAIFLVLGGLIGAIPWLGDLLAGGFYVLALLGGGAMGLVLIALVLGFNLLWPTIAVEGSDAFDAITHAAGYVAQRIWHYAWYTLVLLTYGGICFVTVRLIAILLLKLTHVFTATGMSFFGLLSSAETSTINKLDAIWRMPAWAEISILPTPGKVAFWGEFWTAPLGIGETIGFGLIAFWVFIIVGLVAAFVLSFYFCGGTMMYFLLRKDVDATDYDEVFYEEADEVHAEPAPAAAPAPTTPGTPLPVMGGGTPPPTNPPTA